MTVRGRKVRAGMAYVMTFEKKRNPLAGKTRAVKKKNEIPLAGKTRTDGNKHKTSKNRKSNKKN